MGFVIVLLVTVVANLVSVPQAECIGKGGNSDGQPGGSEEKSRSQEQQCEIDEAYRAERLPKMTIGKKAKTGKSGESLEWSGNDAQETPANTQSTSKQTKRRSRRNQTKGKAKQSDHTSDKTTSSASKLSSEKETTETTEAITNSETMPITQAEQAGETTNNLPPPGHWGRLDEHLLAVQCPMLGRQGALYFEGKEIS